MKRIFIISLSAKSYELLVHGCVCQLCGFVIATDNWLTGMGTYLSTVLYYNEPQIVSVYLWNVFSWSKVTHCATCASWRRCPPSTVLCKRQVYRWVENFPITFAPDENKIWELIFFLGEACFVLNRNMSNQNKRCWCKKSPCSSLCDLKIQWMRTKS